MEAATTLWYTTAKEFLLACKGGREKVYKVFIELEYTFIFFFARQYLVHKFNASWQTYYTQLIQLFNIHTSNIPFLVCFSDKPGLFVLNMGILVPLHLNKI